jgi:hypothetical protein
MLRATLNITFIVKIGPIDFVYHYVNGEFKTVVDAIP